MIVDLMNLYPRDPLPGFSFSEWIVDCWYSTNTDEPYKITFSIPYSTLSHTFSTANIDESGSWYTWTYAT